LGQEDYLMETEQNKNTLTMTPADLALEVLLARKNQHDQEETIGERMARLRRERGITQVELAEMLKVPQPMISAYENGGLRLHGELIVELTKILDVSADQLLGLKETKNGPAKNGRLLRKLQQLELLPRRDQQALMRTIEAFLQRAS
jgi:transcriptional regulator with XRE-family HTH domain